MQYDHKYGVDRVLQPCYNLLLIVTDTIVKGIVCMTRSHNLGMRILSVLLCLVCLLPMLQIGANGAEQKEMTLTTVVRNGASSGKAVIGQLENGTQINVLKKYRTYYKVDCYDMNGYIAASQIVHKDGKYYIDCKEGSSETRSLSYTDYEAVITLRNALLNEAKKHLKTRYVYGGMSPRGFDCSGFTSYVYNKQGISLHRTASTQLQDGIVVSRDGLQVGDLIFFREGRSRTPATHVGIYVGDNQMIHASSSRGITYDNLDNEWCSRYYLCARRIINSGAGQVELAAETDSVSNALVVNSVSGRTAH